MERVIKVGIYKITSPSGKIYIGQSTNINRRIRKYKCLYESRRQIALNRSFLKHGYENHTFEIKEECEISVLNDRERYWQDFYNVIENGLNCKTTTTTTKTGRLSSDTVLKMSKSLKGRIISKEQRVKLSIAGKGRKNSPIAIKKLTDFNKTRIFSVETKEKMVMNNPRTLIILDFNTGIYYYSVADLSRVLNVNPSTLFDRLKGRRNIKNKTNYKIV